MPFCRISQNMKTRNRKMNLILTLRNFSHVLVGRVCKWTMFALPPRDFSPAGFDAHRVIRCCVSAGAAPQRDAESIGVFSRHIPMADRWRWGSDKLSFDERPSCELSVKKGSIAYQRHNYLSSTRPRIPYLVVFSSRQLLQVDQVPICSPLLWGNMLIKCL